MGNTSGNNSNVTSYSQINSTLYAGSHGQPQFLNLLLPAQAPRHLLRNHLHSSHGQAPSSLWAHLHIPSTAKLSGDEEGEAAGEISWEGWRVFITQGFYK